VTPKRTIRFVLFTGEEQGLHGSRVYTEKHKDEMERTSAALVHDTGTGRVRGVGAGAWPAHRAILERELISLKELGVTDFNARSSGGSDHASFSRIGVPGLMLVQDMTTYTYTHHTQADTLDAVNAPNLIQGAQTMAVTAMRIANLKELLPRVPTGGGRRFGGE
jgi:Zn-dependent M28 family amino/carboxypeptidase